MCGFLFLHILSTICYCLISYYHYLGGCEVLSSYIFNLYFLNDWWCWAYCVCSLVIHIFSLVKYLFKPFAHFFVGLSYWVVSICCKHCWIQCFIKQRVCKIFSPSLLLIFSFFHWCILKHKHFDHISLSNFSFCGSCFWCHFLSF